RDNTAWRRYQDKLRHKSAAHKTLRRLPGYVLILFIALVLIKGGFFMLEAIMSRPATESSAGTPETERISRSILRQRIDPAAFVNAKDSKIQSRSGARAYTFHTSLDPDLQESLISMMDRRWSRQIAIVVMDPQTGRILGMASLDKTGSGTNPCLSAAFPAASLFKIITAAAGMESCGYGPETRLNFNGGKYTLYRSQLEETTNQYTNSITLEQAFSQSVNPVFGKIGKNCLGGARLEKYATRFGFNREIDFDLPLDTSVVKISDQAYNWAETACGFNSTTRISPLHGAMLAAAVVNNGRLMVPRIVDTASVNGRVVYRGKTEILNRCVTPETARRMRPLMDASVIRGTARGSFRGKTGQKLLRNFHIGGKTGSINNNPQQLKYDWFAGYAQHRKSGEKIAVSILVAHEKYLGTRSPEYFRKIVSDYFENRTNTSESP
ncbi:MAG: penicillin-binding transpeptidase domain-containing protein, partial [Desulfobacterales bacterium]